VTELSEVYFMTDGTSFCEPLALAASGPSPVIIVLALAACLLQLIGYVMLLIAAFRESVLWGMLGLVPSLGVVALVVFGFMHGYDDTARRGLFTYGAGFALMILALVVAMAMD